MAVWMVLNKTERPYNDYIAISRGCMSDELFWSVFIIASLIPSLCPEKIVPSTPFCSQDMVMGEGVSLTGERVTNSYWHFITVTKGYQTRPFLSVFDDFRFNFPEKRMPSMHSVLVQMQSDVNLYTYQHFTETVINFKDTVINFTGTVITNRISLWKSILFSVLVFCIRLF